MRTCERTLCNHNASHIIIDTEGRWEGPSIPLDPCMYCCSSMNFTGCKVNIVESKVNTNYKEHYVPAFNLSWIKKNKLVKFPSSNQPVKCLDCSTRGRKKRDVFIPKYNILKHYKKEHDLDYNKEHTPELNGYVICEKEKKEVVDKFRIIGLKDSTWAEGDCVGGGKLAEATTISQDLDESES